MNDNCERSGDYNRDQVIRSDYNLKAVANVLKSTVRNNRTIRTLKTRQVIH